MDKLNQKMRKFNLRGVLENLRSSVQDRPLKVDLTIEETLRSEHFQIIKTARHGFPFQPTALAFDPVQNLLAIGTKSGQLRIFGRPGVQSDVRHEGGNSAVVQLMFLVNEGALISICADDTIHMWTLRQKKPEIVHSLKFQRERITCCHLAFQSKWLFIGTERGNVHVVNLETFSLSGYVISWNKAMELIRLAHPGPVVHLSDNPLDTNKLLIGFETGSIVLWDLKNKVAESRYQCTETLRSACWHHEGKQFICSHSDGSITLWNSKNTQKPHSFLIPHSRLGKDGRPETCRPIVKVDYRTVRNSEPFIIFSGGTSTTAQTPSLTVMHGNNMTVLEMEHPVIDFVTLCSTPYNSDFQDPFAIAVLLQNDLVVVDLTTTGYPCFENPYPMDIQEAPVTTCQYFADCPPDLIPAFYSVGCKNKAAGYSEKEWPIHGGEWSCANCSYPEIIITGHADGSVKFWDASSGKQLLHSNNYPKSRLIVMRDTNHRPSLTLQVLCKLKTAKVFDENRQQRRSVDDDECPFAVQHIFLCVDSRLLCIAGSGHVVLFRFNKQETTIECPVLEVNVVYEINDAGCDTSETFEYPVVSSKSGQTTSQLPSYSSQSSNGKEVQTTVRAKAGARKWPPGYQPSLCCLLTWIDSEPAPPITSLSVNSRFGLLAFGNECGIAIIDIIQRSCLLSMGTPDLYGSMDPYSRAPRSPRLKLAGKSSAADLANIEDCRSPTVEQLTLSAVVASGSCSSEYFTPRESITDSCPRSATINCTGAGSTFPSAVKHLESIRESMLLESSDESDSGFIVLGSSDEKPAYDVTDCIPELYAKARTPTAERDRKFVQKSPDVVDGSAVESFDKAQRKEAGSENTLANNEDPVVGSEAGSVLPVPSSTDDGCLNDQTLSQPQFFPDQSSSEQASDQFQSDGSMSQLYSGAPPKRPSILRRLSSGFGKKREKFSKNPLIMQSNVGSDSPFMGTPGLNSTFMATLTPDVCVPATPAFGLGCNTCSISQASTSSATSGFFMTPASCTAVPSLWTVGVSASEINSKLFKASSDEDTVSTGSAENENNNQSEASIGVGGGIKPVDQIDGGFLKMMGRKLKNLSRSKEEDYGAKRRVIPKPEVVDFSTDAIEGPIVHQLTYSAYCAFCADRADNSFSRSHSSSMTSLENVNKEAIDCLFFAEAYTRKTDTLACPCLWVGTSLGTVLVISLTLPTDSDARRREPVMVSPSGTIFRLKGSILTLSFLDCNGVLIPPVAQSWKEGGGKSASDVDSKKDKTCNVNRQQSALNVRQRISPTASLETPQQQQNAPIDQQFVIVCSEKQARLISLPSQTCIFKAKITETSVVAKAEVIQVRDSVCLACFVANGHIMTFSLPSLRPLLDVDFIPFPDVRIARTICFSSVGNVIYLCSPSEIQKLSLLADAREALNEMQGELFVPKDMPEAPKQGFFKNLLNLSTPTASSIDREELFGESCSGKASKGFAVYTAGPAGMSTAQEGAASACSDIARAKMLALERGEKLGELDERTEAMKLEAEQFSLSANKLKNKYKDKKWYQF